MPGPPVLCGRRLTAPLWATLLLMLLLAPSACQRDLENAPCECATGWICCSPTNICMRADQLLLHCPALAQDAPTETAPDGSAKDMAAETVPPDARAQETASETRPPERSDASGAPDGDARGSADADANGEASVPPGDGGVDGNDETRDARVDTAPPDVPGLCTGGGWCWTHPLPTGDRFFQSFGIGDEVWAISATGAIACFRPDGTWYTVPSPPMPSVYSLWGLKPNDVLAGGDEGEYQWDGSMWTALDPGTDPSHRAVYAIWGCAGTDDFWAVGDAVGHWTGKLGQGNGGHWSFPALPAPQSARLTFKTMWGSGCSDVWAGGTELSSGAGAIIHWDGTAWTPSASTPSDKLIGTTPEDVWSLAGGALWRWDGSWTQHASAALVTDLFAAGPGQIGALDASHKVTLFTGLTPLVLGVDAPADVTTMYARSSADLWGFGGPGTVRRWTGGSGWDPVLQPWSLDTGSATRVTGSSAADLWAAVGGTLLIGNGSTWSVALTPAQTGGRVRDIWARAADDVRVLGGDGAIHRWNGSKGWTSETPTVSGGTSSELRAITGTGPNDAWVIRGSNTVLHSDGKTWVPRQPPQLDNLVDVWAAGPDEAWVVGSGPLGGVGVGHWLNGGWVAVQVPAEVANTPFSAVAGGGGDVYFLAGGRVLRADSSGENLSVVFNSDSRVVALYVAGHNDGWLLQQEAALTRVYRITADINKFSIAPAGMNDIWAAPDGTVWLAGEGGALLSHPPMKM